MGAWEFPHSFLSCRILMFSPLKFWRVLLRGLQNPSPNPIFHLIWHSTKSSHLRKSVFWDHSRTALLSVWHYLDHLLFILPLNSCEKLQTTREFSLGGKLLNMNVVNMGLLNPSSFFYTHTHTLPPYLKACGGCQPALFQGYLEGFHFPWCQQPDTNHSIQKEGLPVG